ncbi:MAG: hypothetical protein K2X03_26055 [Bryobacteraceae bacterium]|nr:hypothetical protein [Bryobacteraceae bacterium]
MLAAQQQLDGFLDAFTPEVAALARKALAKMHRRYPTATALVYDNYNALAIAFAPSERASEAIFSLALYPRWVSLFFAQAKQLPDPHGLLKGSGSTMRHIVLEKATLLDDPRVKELMVAAVKLAKVPFPASGQARVVIKSVSAKQRPRRPG